MSFPVFVCQNCGKELKPHCDMKSEDGFPYCTECHWDLWGRERMKKRFKGIYG